MNWNIEDFIGDLEQLVNIDSGTASVQGVGRVAQFFYQRFKGEGFVTQLIPCGPKAGPCLEARSSEEQGIDVLLVGHMDTVFPAGTTAQRPFQRKDGILRGPGVADMKSGLMLLYTLAVELKKNCPRLRVCAAMNCDEETGSFYSKEWIDRLAEESRSAFVFEPGRGGGDFVIQRKGCMDITARFYGVAAHAGNDPEKGASAVRELAHFILEMTKLQDLANGTSVNAGLAKGGTASNVVADYAECTLDVRFTEPKEMDRIQERAEALASAPLVENVRTEIEILGAVRPLLPTDATRELMASIERIGEGLGQTIGWRSVGGVSDANHMAGKCPAVLCGCGPSGDDYHSQREYTIEGTIKERLELLYRLFSEMDSRGI